MEGATLTHTQGTRVLASTRGEPDLVGVSRRMRRLSGSLGNGGRKDVFVTVKELVASNEGWGELSPFGTHKRDPHEVDEGESSIAPEEWEVLSAIRKEG